MKSFYIVRHGQSQSNVGGEAMPNAHIPLTTLGHKQACEVADWLLTETKGNIDSIGVSKYVRTQLTAQPLLDRTGMKTKIIPNFQEFNPLCFLRIEGKPIEYRNGLSAEYWQEKTPDYIDGAEDFSEAENTHLTQAESFSMFAERTTKVLTHLHSMEQGTHVLFGHGMWMSMLIWQMLGLKVDNQQAMQDFHKFELAIRPHNGDVYLLQLHEDENVLPAITKVRML